MAFEKIVFAMKTWKDKVSGNTPVTAAELNRIEKGISDCAKQTNALGDSVSQLCAADHLREFSGNDFNNIEPCFQAIYQESSWTKEQHGPVGANVYGFLISVNSGGSSMQIFVDTLGKIVFRVRFSGTEAWPEWSTLNATQ